MKGGSVVAEMSDGDDKMIRLDGDVLTEPENSRVERLEHVIAS